MLAALVLALATTAAALPQADLQPRARNCVPFITIPFARVTNPANCVTTVPSYLIDDATDGLLKKTTTNWAGGKIPTKLRGIFYMEGNPNSAETITTATAFWNSSSKTFDIPTYAPRTWTQDPYSTSASVNVAQGLIFKTSCRNNGTTGLLTCDHTSYYQYTESLQHKGDYTLDETSTPNVWIRGSNMQDFGSYFGGKTGRYYYFFLRIVDENGKRTSLWNDRYLVNIGQTVGSTGQKNVHLQANTEVPNRK